MRVAGADHEVQAVLRACYSADGDLGAVRSRLLQSVRQAVSFDAAFMASCDPETLLFTSAFADEALAESRDLFLDSEFGTHPDVNRFVDLARARDPVASLDAVTGGERAASSRWREIMGPIGMGDELRCALRVDGTTWGFLCLHRSGAQGFSEREIAVIRQVAPHVAEGVRRFAVSVTADANAPSEAVVIIGDHVVMALGGAVEEIDGDPLVVGGRLPVHLDVVVRQLERIETGQAGEGAPPPAIRTTTRSGALVTVHAARLRDASDAGPVVLTIAPSAPGERSSLLLAGYGLTAAQCRVTNLVLQGRHTGQIVVDLQISAHTVQDHLKAIFDKVGVRSRRELVSALIHSSH